MNRAELLQIAKPILFNTEMVRAILNGRKTVTRRVMRPQPKMKLCYAFAGYGHGKWHYPDKDAWRYWGKEFERPTTLSADDEKMIWTPPCHTDDILYVRETWSEWTGGYLYRAWPEGIAQPGAFPGERWRPSIHMPKEAARIFLRVVDVRVERLLDITEEQAKAEGAINNIGFIHSPDNEYDSIYTSKEDFIQIWNSTIKKSDIDRYGWDANPFVWVIKFEMVEVE